MMIRKFFIAALFLLTSYAGMAQILISDKNEGAAFPIVTQGKSTSIVYDAGDDSLIQIVANLFMNDIKKVTGRELQLKTLLPLNNSAIIIGTLEKSTYIQQMVKAKKLNVDRLKGQWDGYQVQVVDKPFKGMKQALVIVGSNKRGAAYGAFELSRQMGVSPWYWWADVPVKTKKELYCRAGIILQDAPKVKYRGFFINDEAPCFSGWTKEKFGGVNHKVYVKIFELLLRLKANYLWPAMWSNAFNDDDKLNPILADKWGIVMGTSHHEPMQRSQQEWKRYGAGPWDYTKNDTELKKFWKKGIENMGTHESVVTLGMRGDGDKPMTSGTAIDLLEKIVKDQRNIIEEVTKKPASETPQVWALYKEVQDYYDQGMRVPDDVTLLFSDDNYGDIRRLPKLTDKPRTGGYGIYYHFDYVGDPRNYKWINTNNIARVWEQMHLAYAYGVRNIWIVNVGDIKPMEFPISFFMDYAWNPDNWNENNLMSYYTTWAGKQFSEKYAQEIGDIMRKYAHYTARRKPELVDANTYSIDNYHESQEVVKDFNELVAEAEKVNNELPGKYRDAYFELVLHPLKANANLHEMYEAAALNKWYADQDNVLANKYAEKVKRLYIKDSLLSVEYNKKLANGKWDHMMDQVHIGYKTWNDPRYNEMPDVKYVNAATVQPQAHIARRPVEKTAEKMLPKASGKNVFFEKDGYVSIEASHFTRAIVHNGIRWAVIPDIGRTGSGITPFPVTAAKQQPGRVGSRTEYDFYSYDGDIDIKAEAYFSPTLNFQNEKDGLQYAVSIDNEKPQIVTIDTFSKANTWRGWAANNIIIKATNHKVLTPGKHTLKYWMIHPGVVLQKIVLDFGGEKPSYLGPLETRNPGQLQNKQSN